MLPAGVHAQACQPLYGGGVTEQEYCPTPPPDDEQEPLPQEQAEQPVQNDRTTKGGLPVKEPSQTDTTPDTGPAALGLLGLLPVGAIGLYFRHKARA